MNLKQSQEIPKIYEQGANGFRALIINYPSIT